MSKRHKNKVVQQERLEISRECSDRREHYTNLLVWGHCTRCLRAFSLPNDDTKVFERLNNLVASGV